MNISSCQHKKMQIHEVLQLHATSFHISKLLQDNSCHYMLSIWVDVTILFCYVYITFLFLCNYHYPFVIKFVIFLLSLINLI